MSRPDDPPRQPGRIARARHRVDEWRADAAQRADDLQARVPVVRSVFAAYERDRRVGGEIMAGAIAFRMFVFMLPLTLALVALGGLVADADTKGAADVSKQLGISGLAAKSISESAQLGSGSRWIALAVALFFLYGTSLGLARAMRIAHALAWGEVVEPVHRSWRVALVVVGTVVGVVAVLGAVTKVRAESPTGGLLATLLCILVYAGVWFALSLRLPHADAPPIALVPGAIVVAVGVQALHVVTVYYLTRKVSSSTSLYGPIGAAIGILLWAYFFGRLTVASAVINASRWRASPDEFARGPNAGTDSQSPP